MSETRGGGGVYEERTEGPEEAEKEEGAGKANMCGRGERGS